MKAFVTLGVLIAIAGLGLEFVAILMMVSYRVRMALPFSPFAWQSVGLACWGVAAICLVGGLW